MSEDRGWTRWAARLTRSVDRRVDETRVRLLGERQARQIVPYRGFGTATDVFISGRVLANRPSRAIAETDRWWRNLATALHHLESDEVPAARLSVRVLGAERQVVTDDEGYFHAWLKTVKPPSADALWHHADIEVLDRIHPSVRHVRATGHVLIPSTDARFGVISDLDDTVIRTEATRLLRMLRRTLLENARTRLPFPGVAQFYTALHGGASGVAHNPVFYVSSSPWNLYTILVEFLEHQSIPAGPLLLRDWGISGHGMLPTRHGAHKLDAIRQILMCYPSLPFILIGDSGQEDPEIYRDIVHDIGARVLAVYIRNVGADPNRTRAIVEMAEEVSAAGSVLLLSDDTAASARHAAARGWITDRAAADVERAVSSGAARPD